MSDERIQVYDFSGHLHPLPPGINLPMQISGKVCLASEAKELEQELARWKRIATYLADCHAATAEGVRERKSSSQSERRRQASICERALTYLRGGDPGYQSRNIEPVVERLVRLSDTPEAKP